MTKTFADAVKGNVKSNSESSQPSSNKKNAKMASDGQVKLYKQLCERKNISPADHEGKSFEEVDKLIKEIQNYFPVSDNQKKAIRKKIANLQEMGVKIQTMTEEQLDNLEGGRDGSASKLIEQLIQWEEDNKDTAPPSKEQLDTMVDMYNCPDCAFEDYDISRIKELGNGYWERLTSDEFREVLAKKFIRSQASEFISKHRASFDNWKNNLISDGQKKFIRNLENRLSKLQNSSEVEIYIDDDGVIQHRDNKTKKDVDCAYTAMEERELNMLSRQQANQHINQLQKELQNKELKSGFSESELDDTTNRYSQSTEQSQLEFKKEIEGTAYQIQALLGYQDDELVDLLNNWLVEDKDAVTKEGKKCRLKLKNVIEELNESESDYTIREALPEALIKIYEEMIEAEMEGSYIS